MVSSHKHAFTSDLTDGFGGEKRRKTFCQYAGKPEGKKDHSLTLSLGRVLENVMEGVCEHLYKCEHVLINT